MESLVGTCVNCVNDSWFRTRLAPLHCYLWERERMPKTPATFSPFKDPSYDKTSGYYSWWHSGECPCLSASVQSRWKYLSHEVSSLECFGSSTNWPRIDITTVHRAWIFYASMMATLSSTLFDRVADTRPGTPVSRPTESVCSTAWQIAAQLLDYNPFLIFFFKF